MTNTQHAELMAALGEILAVLKRNEIASLGAESIPAEVIERAATLGPVVDGTTGERETPDLFGLSDLNRMRVERGLPVKPGKPQKRGRK